jgi:elongation factor 3
MAPAISEQMPLTTDSVVKAENRKSVKVIEQLISKLSVSNAQDEINSTALDIATFINGDIEEHDAPTQ